MVNDRARRIARLQQWKRQGADREQQGGEEEDSVAQSIKPEVMTLSPASSRDPKKTAATRKALDDGLTVPSKRSKSEPDTNPQSDGDDALDLFMSTMDNAEPPQSASSSCSQSTDLVGGQKSARGSQAKEGRKENSGDDKNESSEELSDFNSDDDEETFLLKAAQIGLDVYDTPSPEPVSKLPNPVHHPKGKDVPHIDHAKRDYLQFVSQFHKNENIVELADIHTSVDLAPILEWHEGGFTKPIIDELIHNGYLAPTDIQAMVMAAALSGNDVMAIAHTGSGKTLAFVLPMLRHVIAQPYDASDGPMAIVLAPTRELCAQIYKQVQSLASAAGIEVCCAYGGSDIKPQIDQLRRGRVHIVIATPGRLIDLLAANKGKVLSTLRVSFVVVDEADRMFDMGFSPQIEKITSTIRPDCQTIMCSATFANNMQVLAGNLLHHPVAIHAGKESKVEPHIEQKFLVLKEDEKVPALVDILKRQTKGEQAIVFVKRQEIADELAARLIFEGIICSTLHGGKPQDDRDSTLIDFREGLLSVLVATSVAARGLDVRTIRLVVNFDPPNHLEDYIHRVGRTGRAGEAGKAISLFTADQIQEAFEVSRAFANAPVELLPLISRYRVKTRNEKFNNPPGFGGQGLARLDSAREQERAESMQAHKTGEVCQKAKIRRAGPEQYLTSLEFNDFPMQARRAVTTSNNQNRIIDTYGVTLTMKGEYNKFNDKLRVEIAGPSSDTVQGAFDEFVKLLTAGIAEADLQSNRYTV